LVPLHPTECLLVLLLLLNRQGPILKSARNVVDGHY